jgi:hypothetical protein
MLIFSFKFSRHDAAVSSASRTMEEEVLPLVGILILLSSAVMCKTLLPYSIICFTLLNDNVYGTNLINFLDMLYLSF